MAKMMSDLMRNPHDLRYKTGVNLDNFGKNRTREQLCKDFRKCRELTLLNLDVNSLQCCFATDHGLKNAKLPSGMTQRPENLLPRNYKCNAMSQ